MKKKFLLFALAALPLASAISCSDDDNDNNSGNSKTTTGITVASSTCSESFGTAKGIHSVYMDCSLDSVTGVLTIVVDSIPANQQPTLVLDSVKYNLTNANGATGKLYDQCSFTLKNSAFDLEPATAGTFISKADLDSLGALACSTYNLYKITIKLKGLTKDKAYLIEGIGNQRRASGYVSCEDGGRDSLLFDALWQYKS